MVPGVGQMDIPHFVAGRLDDRGRVVALVKGVRSAVEEADPVPIQASIRFSASSPSSMKSSGCGSMINCRPSRSKIGNSSSIDLRNWASAVSGASGRPLNSELIPPRPDRR